jgi:hypothetical protein
MIVDTEKSVGWLPPPVTTGVATDACEEPAAFGACGAHPQAYLVVTTRAPTTTSASSATAATANLPYGVESLARTHSPTPRAPRAV